MFMNFDVVAASHGKLFVDRDGDILYVSDELEMQLDAELSSTAQLATAMTSEPKSLLEGVHLANSWFACEFCGVWLEKSAVRAHKQQLHKPHQQTALLFAGYHAHALTNDTSHFTSTFRAMGLQVHISAQLQQMLPLSNVHFSWAHSQEQRGETAIAREFSRRASLQQPWIQHST